MRELLYLTVGVFAGGLLGTAFMACIGAESFQELQRELTLANSSRDYWLGVAVQHESACELERGIAIVGQQVDAAAKEMGL